jgi:DNA-binding NtrC family response regulator
MTSILLVDDDPLVRLNVERTLKSAGFSVTTAASGSEALEKLGNKRYSLAIVDLKMPDWTGSVSERAGLRLVPEIKKISPETPVIILTAGSTDLNAVEAMKSGVFDYIVKGTLSSNEFIDIIEKSLGDQNKKHEGALHIKEDHRNKNSKGSLKEWFIDRSFGILDEIVAGLIMSILVFIFGRVFGYLSGSPTSWISSRSTIVFIMGGMIIITAIIGFYAFLQRHIRRKQ